MDAGTSQQRALPHGKDNVMLAQLIADMIVDRLDEKLIAKRSGKTDQFASPESRPIRCPACRQPMLPSAIGECLDEHDQSESHQQHGQDAHPARLNTHVVDRNSEPRSLPLDSQARQVSTPASEYGPGSPRRGKSPVACGSVPSSTAALVTAQATMKVLQRSKDDVLFHNLASRSKCEVPSPSGSLTSGRTGRPSPVRPLSSMPGSSTDFRGPVPESPSPVVIGLKRHRVAPFCELADGLKPDPDALRVEGTGPVRPSMSLNSVLNALRDDAEPRYREAEAQDHNPARSDPGMQPDRAVPFDRLSRVAEPGQAEMAVDTSCVPIEGLKTIQRNTVLRHCEETQYRPDEPPQLALTLLLRCVGVLPFQVCSNGGWSQTFLGCSASWYQWLMPIALLVAFAYNTWLFPYQPNRVIWLADCDLNLSALLCLVSLGVLKSSKELERCVTLLHLADGRMWFRLAWTRTTSTDMVAMLIIWIGAMMLRALSEGLLGSSADDASLQRLFTYSLTVSAIIFIALALQLVCRGLACMLDAFCRYSISLEDVSDIVAHWNITEAVIRRSCDVVERCVAVLVLTTTVCTLICVPEMLSTIVTFAKYGNLDIPSTSLTVLPICLCVLWTVSTAASVTDKCAKVPSFVNHVSLDQQFDTFRHHVVQYIVNSNGGFYMYEVRVTSPLLAKALYMIICIAVAVVSRFGERGGAQARVRTTADQSELEVNHGEACS